MSRGDQPAVGSEQLTAAPPEGASDRIPLPPMPASAPATPPVQTRFPILDGILVVLLLVFAFLVASFKATNSDLFLHLAAGRLIADRAWPAEGDPFSFAASGQWINHAWLYDVALYQLYRLGGPEGMLVVLLKALVVVLLALVLLRTARQPGESLWIPSACTLLALLAISPRLLLQSAVLSFLLLALVVCLLASAVRSREPSRGVWLVPVLCLLWVNLDEWFLLGPLSVALVLLGELMQQRLAESGEQPPEGRIRTLGLVLGASVLACLINPYHVRAFILPTALDPALMRSELARDPQFRLLFLSPFEQPYYQRGLGLNPAGLSWLVLLALNILSFGVTYGQWRWWRLFVCLPFAALAALNLRAIPFFAVVAGPITALNFLDLAREGAATAPPDRRWSVGGRLLTALLALALIVTTIPGWLHATPWYTRQFGWTIEPDEGLRQAAQEIDSWRTEGLIEPGQKWFNLAPEVVYYLAWYAPGEKGYLDHRLGLYRQAAGDYVRLRRSLAEGDRPDTPPAWREVLQAHQVRFLIYHTHSVASTGSTLQRLFYDPAEWVPCFVEGRTSVFAWNMPRATRIDPRLQADFHAQAFGKKAIEAPAEGPTFGQPTTWYQALLELEAPPSPAGNTAFQHYYRFEAQVPRYQQRHRLAWQGVLASSVIALGGQPYGPLANGFLLPFRMDLTYRYLHGEKPPGPPTGVDHAALQLMTSYTEALDPGPIDALYLSVRTARRALRDNPDNALTWLVLAETYSRLCRRTREWQCIYRAVGQDQFACLMPHADMIRRSQVVWALNNALKYNPRPELMQQAHRLLAETYLLAERSGSGEFFQPAVRHFKEYLRLTRMLGMMPDAPPEQFKDRITGLDNFVKELDRQLNARRNQYTLGSANKPVLQQIQLALQNGLAETAVEVLLKADRKQLEDPRNPRERPGATWLVHLLLGLGRLDEARQILLPDTAGGEETVDGRIFGMHPRLRVPAYEWFLVQMAAANGDYENAEKAAGELDEQMRSTTPLALLLRDFEVVPERGWEDKQINMSTFAALLVGHVLLREATQPALVPWKLWQIIPYRLQAPHTLRPIGMGLVQQGGEVVSLMLQHRADLSATRGWLALEQGKISRCSEYARQSLEQGELGNDKQGVRQILFFRSRPLAELCLYRLREKTP